MQATTSSVPDDSALNGSVTGTVRWTLRLEALCALAAAAFAYQKLGFGWGRFAICFFIPDLSLLGYKAGPRVAAAVYNSVHSYIGAVVCSLAGVFLPAPALLCAGLIWTAHIAFDRVLGYGLKYSTGFGFTHLGVMGRSKPVV